jgi:hypothetical protein
VEACSTKGEQRRGIVNSRKNTLEEIKNQNDCAMVIVMVIRKESVV